MKIWFRFELVCVVMHLESLCLQSTDERLYNIELQRGARGFGFSIRGGREFNNMPLFILKIADGGSAHTDGRLRVHCNCFLIWYGEFVGAKLQATNRVPRPVDRGTATRYGG